MTLRVFGDDRQAIATVDIERWMVLAQQVLTEEGVGGDAELGLAFVDPREIADLNQRFLGGDGPTDVLAFPLDVAPVAAEQSQPLTLLGDVVVCPSVAAANAPGHAGSVEDEVALLVVHGTLHVLGHDHADGAERQRMQDRERHLLARFHGPLAADPWTDH